MSFFFFLDNHSFDRYEIISHCGFDLHFPDKWCWTSFHVYNITTIIDQILIWMNLFLNPPFYSTALCIISVTLTFAAIIIKVENCWEKIPQFSSVQSLSRVRLFVTPWTAAHQVSLSITNSRSLLKLISIESVMPSKHLILCCPLLLLSSIFPNIRVFSSESTIHIRWPKYSCLLLNITLATPHKFEKEPVQCHGKESLDSKEKWSYWLVEDRWKPLYISLLFMSPLTSYAIIL